MCAPKYQCGLVKLDKLRAHMTPGALKLFATLIDEEILKLIYKNINSRLILQ